jgi:kynureninase
VGADAGSGEDPAAGGAALTTEGAAAALDGADPLAALREQFVGTEQALVYLDGNSLGRLPRATAQRLQIMVEREWGLRLVRGWDEGWMELPLRVGDRLGEVALGAGAGQVAVADSTTLIGTDIGGARCDLSVRHP